MCVRVDLVVGCEKKKFCVFFSISIFLTKFSEIIFRDFQKIWKFLIFFRKLRFFKKNLDFQKFLYFRNFEIFKNKNKPKNKNLSGLPSPLREPPCFATICLHSWRNQRKTYCFATLNNMGGGAKSSVLAGPGRRGLNPQFWPGLTFSPVIFR